MSAVSNLVGMSFMGLALGPGLVFFGAVVFGGAIEPGNLAHPEFSRLGRKARIASSGRNIAIDPAHSRHLRALADRDVIVDGRASAERHKIFQRHTAGDRAMGNNNTMPADRHIVTNLDEVVDFGSL